MTQQDMTEERQDGPEGFPGTAADGVSAEGRSGGQDGAPEEDFAAGLAVSLDAAPDAVPDAGPETAPDDASGEAPDAAFPDMPAGVPAEVAAQGAPHTGRSGTGEAEADGRETARPFEERPAVPQDGDGGREVPAAPGAADVAEGHPAAGQPSDEVPATVELPEELAQEFERLKRMDPAAAAVALEDSPDGQATRVRLEQYGAELAHDHAGLVLMQRQRESERALLREERARQAVQERQRQFMEVMRREHPDFHALLAGDDLAAQMRFSRDVRSWIEAKPYAEAAPLMEIYSRSSDPYEVGRLLTQFRNERRARRPDPAGALAVPGRGGTVAPAGIGDTDDFHAGLTLSLSSN